MALTPYHARYYAALLTSRRSGGSLKRYLPALLSASIDLHPHQIDAALFASRSQFQEGVILADEEGLGKTIEAGIVLLQASLEGKNKLLVLCPPNQINHWREELDNKFLLAQVSLDDVGQEAGVVILSYHLAHKHLDKLAAINWDLCVLDQAHVLANSALTEKAMAAALRSALKGVPKLLLTASPMQNSLLDLYHLIRFIDETAWGGTPELFRSRYMQSDQLKQELKTRAQLICQRTLKDQALTMPDIKRQVKTIIVSNSDKERELSERLSHYFHRQRLAAFPQIEEHRIRLVYWKMLASSPAALRNSLLKLIKRLKTIPGTEDERLELAAIVDVAAGIDLATRSRMLLQALADALASAPAPPKALIFSEYKDTLQHLQQLLGQHGYKAAIYGGGCAGLDSFRNSAEMRILLTTDRALGLDLSFCSLVINYDLPWSVRKLESRISCCHRYGQKHEVRVINFIDPTNRAEKRLYKLLNKKLEIFDNMFGASHTALGQIVNTPDDDGSTHEARPQEELWMAEQKRAEIERQVKKAQNDLLAYFDHEVRGRFAEYGKQVVPAMAQLEDLLWRVLRYKLHNHATIFDDKRMLMMNKASYKGLRLTLTIFGLGKSLPRGERLHFQHPLVKQVLRECLEENLQAGRLTFAPQGAFSSGMSGQLGLWNLHMLSSLAYETHLILCGYIRTIAGEIKAISDDECGNLLKLKVISHTGGALAFDDRPVEKCCSPQLQQLHDAALAGARDKAMRANDRHLREKLAQLNRWAEDEKAGYKLQQDDIINEVDRLKASGSDGFEKRFKLNKAIANLEGERRALREKLFYIVAEVEQKRDELIAKAEEKFKPRFWGDELFVIDFRIQ